MMAYVVESLVSTRRCAASPLTTYHLPPSAMPPSEHTPLLNGQNGEQHTKSFVRRVIDTCKAEGEPGWAHSLRYFLFTSWLNIVLVFVPLSALAHFLNWDVALRFSFSFIAIIPLAKVCLMTSVMRCTTRRTHALGSVAPR